MSSLFISPPGETREVLERIILRLARAAGYRWPFPKGKYRLMMLAESLCRNYPKMVRVPTPDGRMLTLSFAPEIWDTVFFFGEYELAASLIVRDLIDAGDCCIDVGANFGWYTTLFSHLVGPEGTVVSFEPLPETFELLRSNVAFLENSNVTIHNFGLGRSSGEAEMYLFPELGTGHSSIADHGRSDARKIKIILRTYDDCVREKLIERDVVFLKVDIEGAELDFLNGAESLFQQAVPPIILMEMALEQTAAFGYVPNDLIDFISQRRHYIFYSIDMVSGQLRQFERFGDGDIGANVLAVPEGFYQDRLARLADKIEKD